MSAKILNTKKKTFLFSKKLISSSIVCFSKFKMKREFSNKDFHIDRVL